MKLSKPTSRIKNQSDVCELPFKRILFSIFATDSFYQKLRDPKSHGNLEIVIWRLRVCKREIGGEREIDMFERQNTEYNIH